MLCFRKFLVAKKVMDKNGGVAGFSVQTFMSHSDKKIRRGNILCCVLEHFRFRKFMDEIGGVAGFSVEFCMSQSAKKIRRGPLLCSVSKKFR